MNVTKGIDYKRAPENEDSEIHICFRCSDGYAIYAPVLIFSILENNKNSYIYIYIFTDKISDKRWENILSVAKTSSTCEVFKIHPTREDVMMMNDKSSAYHGWHLIHISIYYQKYLPQVKKVFNFGLDAYCVGDLRKIWLTQSGDAHYIGSSSRHQKARSRFSLSPIWIGFDASLLNLDAMRSDGVTPEALADYSIKTIGYIHDEVAHNGLCKKKFLDRKFYYIYCGSYLPKRRLDPDTVLIDFYNNLKAWDISVSGYEVFDRYIEYYSAVKDIIEIEYSLPKSFIEVSKSLKIRGYPFLDWYPISHPIIGEPIYRLCWTLKKLGNQLKVLCSSVYIK